MANTLNRQRDYIKQLNEANKREEKERKFKNKEIAVLEFTIVTDFENDKKEELKRLVKIDEYAGLGTKSYYVSFYDNINKAKEMLPEEMRHQVYSLFQKEISEDYLRKPTEQEMFVYKVHGLISLDDDYEDYEKKNEEKDDESDI